MKKTNNNKKIEFIKLVTEQKPKCNSPKWCMEIDFDLNDFISPPRGVRKSTSINLLDAWQDASI